MPIRICNSIRISLPTLNATINIIILCPRNIDNSIYNSMRDMYSLGVEFSSQALTDSTHGEFAAGETCTVGEASDGCCGAGDD